MAALVSILLLFELVLSFVFVFVFAFVFAFGFAFVFAFVFVSSEPTSSGVAYDSLPRLTRPMGTRGWRAIEVAVHAGVRRARATDTREPGSQADPRSAHGHWACGTPNATTQIIINMRRPRRRSCIMSISGRRLPSHHFLALPARGGRQRRITAAGWSRPSCSDHRNERIIASRHCSYQGLGTAFATCAPRARARAALRKAGGGSVFSRPECGDTKSRTSTTTTSRFHPQDPPSPLDYVLLHNSSSYWSKARQAAGRNT